tara:strand:+ start:383 stop:799 length:417 start_codon:yes stop_codon:yes gene_type:complete
MSDLIITAGPFNFKARFECDRSPQTCASFEKVLPFNSQIVHVRWSGEAVWVPLGDRDFGVGYEDPTSHPSPGEIILYPGGKSETEILIAYGATSFASKAGGLAGNHFASIMDNFQNLRELGVKTLWEGAQQISFKWAE